MQQPSHMQLWAHLIHVHAGESCHSLNKLVSNDMSSIYFLQITKNFLYHFLRFICDYIVQHCVELRRQEEIHYASRPLDDTELNCFIVSALTIWTHEKFSPEKIY